MTLDPSVAPFRLHMGAEGLMISGSKKVPDENGVSYLFNKLTGWDEPPALVQQILKKPNDHGSTAGQGWQGERNLVIEGWVVVPGDDPDQIRAAVDKLFAAIPLEDELLIVHEYGLVRHLMVRQGGQPTGDRIGRKAGANRAAKFSIQLVALEPARLSGDGLYGADKRFDWAPGQPDLVVPVGEGLVPPLYITVTDANTPTVTHVESGVQLQFVLDGSGRHLYLDFEALTATLDGTPVNTDVRGQWPVLRRKQNTFHFDATSFGPAAAVTVLTYETYP